MCPILVMGIKDYELVTIKFWVPIMFNSATTWQLWPGDNGDENDIDYDN